MASVNISPMAATRTYRGETAEERRSQRRERLLEAGLEILGTDGWRALTVTAACAKAGLTERYFYESFSDREGLLVAVYERVAAGLVEAVLERVARAPDDPPAQSRAAIAAVVDYVEEDPRRSRVCFVEAMGSEALWERRLETLRVCAQLMAERARALYPPIRKAGKELELTTLVLVGGFTDALVVWVAGELDVSRDELIDHCSDLFAAAAERTLAKRPRAGK